MRSSTWLVFATLGLASIVGILVLDIAEPSTLDPSTIDLQDDVNITARTVGVAAIDVPLLLTAKSELVRDNRRPAPDAAAAATPGASTKPAVNLPSKNSSIHPKSDAVSPAKPNRSRKQEGKLRESVPTSARAAATCQPFDFYSASLLNGTWNIPDINTYHDESRSFFDIPKSFEVNGDCPLRRFDKAAVQKCLANRHILYIGDSVMRYQFRDIEDWLGEGLQRHDSLYNRTDMNMQMNNFYFYQPEYNISLSYVGFYRSAWGHGPMGARGFKPGHAAFDEEYLWQNLTVRELAPVIRQHLGTVDEVFMNIGLHPIPQFQPGCSNDETREEIRPFESLTGDGRKPIWATVTLQNDRPENRAARDDVSELGCGYAAARELKWRIMDKNGVGRSLYKTIADAGRSPRSLGYMDRTHFALYANREFNNVLLNMICP